MSYIDLIRQEGEYNYSANIQYDIENDKKMLRFIPNETTVSLLREYFTDITKTAPANHARILYGSYGTGKSHFLTVLTMLLGKLHSNGVAFNTFIQRVAEYDPALASDIKSFIINKDRKPLLVVPIVFDFEDFDRCIYFSLKKKLENIGVEISFKTFYDQATSLLTQWKSNTESNSKLIEACKSSGISLNKLEEKLATFDKNSERLFQQVFAQMTFGVKYIYEVSNVTEIINQTNDAIADQYSGIVFVFDEFGRYMEDNIKKIKVKSVQDLAEFCDHSNANNHIILVSHKEISQYTQKYGKNIASEWKKVEGRYKATPINDKQDQCLSLIKNIILKAPDVWDEFQEAHRNELNRIYSEGLDFKGFLIDVSKENPFAGGFPLHPITLYALDKLSKKVAQNERTFFTYLASKEENSLYRFLIRHELDDFHFVGIDEIYDYFEPNIKSVQSDESYSWYKDLISALSKINSNIYDDTPEVKLLKVIATIGIVNDSSALVANKATLCNVIDCPNDILENALTSLCERRVIKYSGSYDRYEFFEASIYDVEAMIEEESQGVQDEAVANTLNEEFVDFVLYPYSYNREYKISRVFIPVYVTSNSLLNQRTLINKLGHYYDGALIMLLADQEESIENICDKSLNLDRTIFFVNTETQNLIKAVKRYVAVKSLENQKARYIDKDPSFEKELMYFKKEISTIIFSSIHEWKNNYSEETFVVAEGEHKISVKSFKTLSDVASNICLNTFYKTLVVNNELLNKNNVSASITVAKKNAIANIINGYSAINYYDLPYLSPDYICIRSLLAKNGLIEGLEDVGQNELSDGSLPQNDLQDLMNTYIGKGKKDYVGFDTIISELKAPPYGLRSGYLSILLAHILMPYKKSLIISSHNIEQELSVELFEEIVRRPNDYSFSIASWSKEQTNFLDSLEMMFKDYIREDSLNKNRLKAIYEAMLSHYKNVSKFARTTQIYVSDETKLYRKVLEKSTTNYSSFFFKKLKDLGSDFDSAISVINNSKIDLENATLGLSNKLTNEFLSVFDVSSNIPLCEIIENRYKNTWEAKRKKSFDYYTNAFLELASKVTAADDDYAIILNISKVLTGFELVYWNDSHKNEFVTRLNEIKTKLDSYEASESLTGKEAKMTLVTSSGIEKTLVFDKAELGALSQTVKNKINATFNNFAMAISYDDKVQIVLSILEDLMEGK